MSNSLMFQRFPTHNGFEDPQFSNFYGQTFPLLKRGVPVQTVHMENLSYANTLNKIKVLVVSYSNMKPNTPEVHKYITDWVKRGGVLIYCGRDDDPYQSVMEWWNTKGNKYKSPSEHLFKLLNINPSDVQQNFKVGKGAVYIIRKNPKEFVLQPNSDTTYINIVKKAYEKDVKAGGLTFKNNFYLERGPYDIISVLDENDDSQPYIVKGPVIDLFDPELPVLAQKTVNPGEQALLYDLNRVVNKSQPKVLTSAARIYDARVEGNSISFIAKSPVNTMNSARVLLPSKPVNVKITDHTGQVVSDVKTSWDTSSNTLYLEFKNSPDGIKVEIEGQ
jgi:hypothetical protein